MGIGRSHDIDHPNFSFVQCDLSNPEQVEALEFELFSAPVTLINNAGIIGQIDRLSDLRTPEVRQVMDVNVSAPTVLMHKVYQKVLSKNDFTLVNISSGAARRAIPSRAGSRRIPR